MRVVLIDSPGSGPGPHWSEAFVAELGAALLHAGGVSVHGLRGTQSARVAVHRVTAGLADVPIEGDLARLQRAEPADVVVHVGVGARGSPNLLWLADRMGSRVVAVVRTSEVVCLRGDLVDRAGQPCGIYDDAERCRRCCGASFGRRPSAIEIENRLDLVVGGLQLCSTVWVESGDEASRLERIGVPRRLVQSAPAGDLVARVAEGLRALSPSS